MSNPQLNLQAYEVKKINGEEILVSLDGRNSFNISTEEKRRSVFDIFKRLKEGKEQ